MPHGTPIQIYIYKNGRAAANMMVPLESANYQLYHSFLHDISKDTRLKKSWPAYAPGTVISSDSVEVNFLPNIVVVSIKQSSSSDWNQYERSYDSTADDIRARILTWYENKSE